MNVVILTAQTQASHSSLSQLLCGVDEPQGYEAESRALGDLDFMSDNEEEEIEPYFGPDNTTESEFNYSYLFLITFVVPIPPTLLIQLDLKILMI